MAGQLNLMDALDRRIDFTADSGKEYRLGEELPTVVVRPRGWHLPELHILVVAATELAFEKVRADKDREAKRWFSSSSRQPISIRHASCSSTWP